MRPGQSEVHLPESLVGEVPRAQYISQLIDLLDSPDDEGGMPHLPGVQSGRLSCGRVARRQCGRARGRLAGCEVAKCGVIERANEVYVVWCDAIRSKFLRSRARLQEVGG